MAISLLKYDQIWQRLNFKGFMPLYRAMYEERNHGDAATSRRIFSSARL